MRLLRERSFRMEIEAALEYARRHGLEAFVAARAGDTVAEVYDNGFDAGNAHALYSGTKSFWGITALYAQADGLLDSTSRSPIRSYRGARIRGNAASHCACCFR